MVSFRAGLIARTAYASGPSIEITGASVLESATIGTTVTTLAVAGGTGTYVFTLTDNAGGKFTTAGTNGVNLNTAAALNYEAATSHTVTVSATNGGAPITRTIVITVIDVNEFAPVITSNGGGTTASISVPENTTAVTTVTATDADTAAVIVYSITGGTDASKFAIGASSGVLTFVTPPDYEVPTDADANRQYIVIVQASDGTNVDVQTITVTVTNVIEGEEGDPFILTAGAGSYLLVGEDMTPITEFVMTADNSGVTNKFVLAGQNADLLPPTVPEDPATTAWVNAVIAAGGTVSTTQRGRVDALIVAYRAAGVWNLLEREWLFAAENKTQAKVDIVATAQWSEPSAAMVHTPGRGLKEGGFGGWLDLGVAPSTSTKFLQISGSIGAYVLTSRTADNDGSAMGSVDGAGGSFCFFRAKNGGGIEHDLCSSNFNTPVNANAQGNYIISRTASTTMTPYKNSTAGTVETTMVALARPTVNWFGFRHNNAGGLGNVTADEMASMFIGGGMNSTQALAKNAALNAYMTAQGCNVY